ncbi:MAG: hypothetical protein HY827_07565 [Actinobacteria bacterium]|nr:hypothetical protein [Actinomycetota bacterium]
MSETYGGDSATVVHRGWERIQDSVLGRGSRVDRAAIEGFMAVHAGRPGLPFAESTAGSHAVPTAEPIAASASGSHAMQAAEPIAASAAGSRPVHAAEFPAVSTVLQTAALPFLSATAPHAAPGATSVASREREAAGFPLLMPTMRLAIVPLTRHHAGSTVALAIATAGRLARATACVGALATVDPDTVRFGRGLGFGRRERAGLSLDGFEPVAICGNVAVLDADDAHAAARAATGRAPLVGVVPADDRLASALDELQPSALLLLADADTSESYLALAREDLASGRRRAVVLTARYTGVTPAFDGALALRVDQSAELRLRIGASPSAATRDNADLVASHVMAGGLRRETAEAPEKAEA